MTDSEMPALATLSPLHFAPSPIDILACLKLHAGPGFPAKLTANRILKRFDVPVCRELFRRTVVNRSIHKSIGVFKRRPELP